MLSILYSDFEQFGCPNRGCDAARGSCVSGGGLSSATCRHCGLKFEVRGYVSMICKYVIYPEEGEYWSSRGVGYDLSGFVRTKKAGERILAMVHEVLGTTECKTFLDYRPSEPTWIQFKFQKEEFDLDMLYPERIMEL